MGSRYIPIQLLNHLQQDATTLCRLLKIIPETSGFSPFGVTSLDQNVRYNAQDGDGTLTYYAAVGMVPEDVMQRGDLSVDNSEVPSLLPEFDIPISEADIIAGVYDNARFVLMLVNYDDLSQGHIVIQEGTIGQVKVRSDGLSFVQELRGLSAQLKQSVCSKDSLTCRAIFGSQPGQVARDWCGYPVETLYETAAVQSVGLENTRTFNIIPESGWEDNSLVPGLWQWTSGANAGRYYEIESNTVGGQISLAYETPYPIQVLDEGRYRPDCNKQARDEEKGCLRWFGEEWVDHFRGEPDIPIGDAGSMSTPGASSSPGQGGSTYVPIDDLEPQ